MKAWWMPTAPQELKALPWLHPAVVGYLEQLIQRDWNILEHGSGGSTLWLAERCAQVTAIEADNAYFEALRARVPPNVTLIRSFTEFAAGAFDLLLIDGAVSERAMYLKAATALVKAGGVVVLDNANRPEYADTRAWLKSKAHAITFEVNPPQHRYCVTDFYRMRGGSDWI